MPWPLSEEGAGRAEQGAICHASCVVMVGYRQTQGHCLHPLPGALLTHQHLQRNAGAGKGLCGATQYQKCM